MQLTERQIIKSSHPLWSECDRLCFLSKNLYNSSLYDIRQHYFKTHKYKHHNQVINDFTSSSNPDYTALPRKVSQQTIRLVGQNFASFFQSLKAKQTGKHTKQIRLPKYKNKTNGRTIVTFPKDSISKKSLELREGLFDYVVSPKDLNFRIKSKVKNPDCIRIVPKANHYVIEVVYTAEDIPLKKDNSRYASVDLGVNNLLSVYYNTGDSPELYSGRVVKTVNQYYNKEKARLQKQLGGEKKTSKRIKCLTLKRNNKIDWLLHEYSSKLVSHLVSKDISQLIIGHNKEWKQDINIGKRNNQSFVMIPFGKLISQLEYKCARVGIRVVLTEESYSSKASFMDKDFVPVYNPVKPKKYKFSGRRVKRGLYKTKSSQLINADVNGAGNIMRKVIPDEIVYSEGIEAVVGQPVRVKIFA